MCLSTGGREYLGRYHPGQVHPPGTRYTPWAGTSPWDQLHPPTHPPPWSDTPPRTRYTPLGPGTPPGQVHPPPQGPGTPPRTTYPPCSACWEIRATSGRYASYWNAFLSSSLFACFIFHDELIQVPLNFFKCQSFNFSLHIIHIVTSKLEGTSKGYLFWRSRPFLRLIFLFFFIFIFFVFVFVCRFLS